MIYYQVVSFALALGMQPSDLKLLTGLFVLALLGLAALDLFLLLPLLGGVIGLFIGFGAVSVALVVAGFALVLGAAWLVNLQLV